MKKANKKLAGAIVLGLMLAVPVGASAAGELHEGINKTDGSNTVVGDFGTNIKFGKDIHANNTEAIYLKGNSSETKTSLIVNGDVVEFTGTTKSGTSDGTGNFAAWQDGNSELTINANELIIGSAEMGSDRGFQMKGEGNTLNINADKIVAYVGDGFINAQGVTDTTNTSVVNIGTAQDRIGLFEAHTTYGKDDYGVAILQANEGNTVNLYADKAILDGSEYKVGGVIGTGGYGTVNVDVTDLTIDGNICGTYGTRKDIGKVAELNVKADILKMDGDINVGSMEIDKSKFNRDTVVNVTVANNANITGDINVYGNNKDGKGDDSTANLNFAGTATIIGDINVEGALGNVSINATTDNAKVDIVGNVSAKNGSSAYIDLGNGGSFTGSVNDDNVKSAGEAATFAARETSTGVTLNMGNGSVWNVTGNSTVSTITGEGTVALAVSKTGDATPTYTATTVTGDTSNANLTLTASNYDADTVANLAEAEDIFDALKTGMTGGAAAGVTGMEIKETITSGAITADENGKNVQQARYSTTEANMRDIASVALVAWRQEDSTLSQRLGELRNSEGDQGIWARMSRGEFEYGGAFKNQYNYFQLGYDWAAGDWHYGAAVSHNDGQTTYASGNGENDSTSLTLYGTWLGDKGQYTDIVVKQGKLNNEFTNYAEAGVTTGDYDMWGTSISAEYGQKLEMENDWYVTPQAQLTYMRIGGEDYTATVTKDDVSNPMQVSQDGMDSFVGRIGFEAGKNISEKGSIYAKASLLHEFAGEADTTLVYMGQPGTYSQDLGDTWYECGFGVNYKTSDNSYVYADVVKTFGGDVETPWQWNAGMRWSF